MAIELEAQSYGRKVAQHFAARGLTMVGPGQAIVEWSDKGWFAGNRWQAGDLQATIDGLKIALMLSGIEERVPGDTGVELADACCRLPIGLTAEDLAALDSGEWAEAVKGSLAPGMREAKIWGLERREEAVFAIKGWQGHIAIKSEPWCVWFATKSWAWFSRRLALAISAFEDLAASDLAAKDSRGFALGTNMARIGERIGAEKSQIDLLARALPLFNRNGFAAQGLGWLCKAAVGGGDDLGAMLSMMARAWGHEMSPTQACAPWGPGPWTRAGFLRAMPLGILCGNLVPAWQPRSIDGIGRVFFERLFAEDRCAPLWMDWASEEDLMRNFYQPFYSGPVLELDGWRHVGAEVADIAAAIAASPVKVLLWGEPGAGKSSLAAALAKTAGRSALRAPDLTAGENNGKAFDLSVKRLEAVMAAEKLAAVADCPLMVVDECEPILRDAEQKAQTGAYLESRGCPQVWIANDLKDVHEAFLRRFDFILKVPAMPLLAREELASKLFGKGALASRLAQTMRNPAELVAAASWCEAAGEWSWEVVSRRMAGHQYAVAAASKGEQGHFEVVPAGSIGLAPSDFAGSPRLSAEITKIAGFFEDPAKFAKLGAKIPKGYLLCGPAGSGKTLFVRVLAATAGVPMLVASGAALAEKPGRFADLFAEARKRAPCLVFVDEFDVVGCAARGMSGLSLERQKILNGLLVELDGFDPLEGVLFLAATHNDRDIDEAVRRPGRLGRSLHFGLPDPTAREAVWRAHLSGAAAGPDIDWRHLAEQSRGFSNAEIAEAADRAKLEEAMRGSDAVRMPALAAACDVVFWGEADEAFLTEEGKWRLAVHEAAHALAAARRGLRPDRATLRPREGFMGAVSIQGEEGSLAMLPSEADAMLAVNLAGYAAEEMVFGEASSGASADLAAARSSVGRMLLAWGFGEEIGMFTTSGGEAKLSEKARVALEAEGSVRIARALKSVREMLSRERAALERLGKELLAKRDMTGKEILACVGPAPLAAVETGTD